MAIPVVSKGRRQANKLWAIQSGIILLIGLLMLAWGIDAALALITGGFAVLLPAALFNFMVFARSGAQASKKVVKAFYLGEALKMFLSAVLIVIAFLLFQSVEMYVLAGFILALLSQWMAPIFVKTQ